MRDFIIKNLKEMGVQNQATINKVIAKGKNSIGEGLELLREDLLKEDWQMFLHHIHNVKGILLNMGFNEVAAAIKKIEEHVKVSQLNSQAKTDFYSLKEELLDIISQL